MASDSYRLLKLSKAILGTRFVFVFAPRPQHEILVPLTPRLHCVREIWKRSFITIACSRLSVSDDNRKSERATSGITSERDPGEKRRARRPPAFSIVPTDRAAWNRLYYYGLSTQTLFKLKEFEKKNGFSFSCDGKRFGNGTFRKWWCHDWQKMTASCCVFKFSYSGVVSTETKRFLSKLPTVNSHASTLLLHRSPTQSEPISNGSRRFVSKLISWTIQLINSPWLLLSLIR